MQTIALATPKWRTNPIDAVARLHRWAPWQTRSELVSLSPSSRPTAKRPERSGELWKCVKSKLDFRSANNEHALIA